ncbi:unnamed protein product [Closterium sp. NIES-54]
MKDAFVALELSGDVKNVCGFNVALQDVQGRGTVALQGAARKQVLILDVLYVPGVHACSQSAQGERCQDEGRGRQDASHLGGGGRARSGDVYRPDPLHRPLPCSAKMTTATTEMVALRAIVLATKSTPARWHPRLAHIGVDTFTSSAKHKVTTGLDIETSTGTDSPSVSCVGGKLAWHTFPDKGSDAEDALAIVHIDLCGPFRVAANDGSLYDLLLKDRKTQVVWVRSAAKNSDVLREFAQWLEMVERKAKKLVLMMGYNRGGDFLGKEFTAFVDGKAIVHDLTCPYTPQQNGMAELEMRTVVELTMTVKEALASWKGKAVKAAMDEETRSLIGMGTWELVKRPPGVNIMKNRWVLTKKYRIDDTVEREKARLVVKGFTQVYGADYDERYAPVSSYITLRIFLSIVAILNLNVMQLDMKNAFLQSKLYRVDTALYFKVGGNGVAYWVLVYVDDLQAISSSTAMLKELKELLKAAFKLREISPVKKYLGLEIVHNRPARKLWLH